MNDSVCVSSPGRVCFVGENLDWISGPVIPCAIEDLRIYVLLKRSKGNKIIVKSHNPFNASDRFDVHDKIEYTGGPLDCVRAVFDAFKEAGFTLGGIGIEIKTTLPAAAGLSSSAALCVSLVGGLNELFSLQLPLEDVCDLAYRAEAKHLVTGCGQMDQYSCGLGGLLFLECSKEPPAVIERLYARNDVAIVIGDTRMKRRTGDIISGIRQRLAEGEPLIQEYVKRTQRALETMRKLLQQEWEPEAVGKILTSCHAYLRDYEQVSNDALERYVQAALKAGAFGAKITGAGKGGCMFSLTKRENAQAESEAITQAGGVTYITQIATKGLTLEDSSKFQRL